MNARAQLRRLLQATYVGPIAVAWLAAMGLGQVLRAAQYPIADGLARVVNRVALRFDLPLITRLMTNWEVVAVFAAYGFGALLGAWLLALWLYPARQAK